MIADSDDGLRIEEPIPIRSNEDDMRNMQDQEDVPEASTTHSGDFHVSSYASSEADHDLLPMPVWMRESKSVYWRWVPLPLRKLARFLNKWSYGPNPPQIQRLAPFSPTLQEAPLRLVERFLPRRVHKLGALLMLYFAWILTFVLVIQRSAASGNIEGYGTPSSIWWGANFWCVVHTTMRCIPLVLMVFRSDGNGCGLNGNDCRPFVDATFPFRCPGDVARKQIYNVRVVGDQEIIFKPFVVGGWNNDTGEATYRADSFICQAAVHAGIISDSRGGCGVARLQGGQKKFAVSSMNGVTSHGFDSHFPKSYSFVSDLISDCGVVDMRWPLLGVTITFTTILSIFVSSPAVFFGSIFTMLFIHVGFVSDPPNILDYPSLSSVIVGRFLPAAFTAYVFFRYCVRRSLTGLTAQLEKTVLWLGGAWVGSLNNYTFDFIPIQRLTPRDIDAQPGGVLALVIIVLIIFCIALGQIYYLRLEGRFRRYLALYTIFVLFLLGCVALPMLNLRIHHYALALLLLPGTSIQTRPSLLYQGLLVGLFINGIARWGFDPILQTSSALFGGGTQQKMLPTITAVVSSGAKSINFSWEWPPAPYDGLSVLVNDVERYRWYFGEGKPSYTWKSLDADRMREYFRFAYIRASSVADYTRAGVWEINGNWTHIPD